MGFRGRERGEAAQRDGVAEEAQDTRPVPVVQGRRGWMTGRKLALALVVLYVIVVFAQNAGV